MIISPSRATRCAACVRPAIVTVNVLLVTGERNIRVTTTMHLCLVHRDAIRLDDVMTPEAWARMSAPFIAAGHPAPDRERCRLEFVPIRPIVHPTEKILKDLQ